MLSRGSCAAKGSFTDDSGAALGEFQYAFDVKSAWPRE